MHVDTLINVAVGFIPITLSVFLISLDPLFNISLKKKKKG